jgi:HlyD family secretion protein
MVECVAGGHAAEVRFLLPRQINFSEIEMLAFIKKNYKKLLALALLAVFGIWYFFLRSDQAEYVEYQVSSQDITESLELSGKVSAKTAATLRFPTGGLVTYLGAQKGDTVKKYQTLASLDTRQTRKILDQKLNLYAMQRGTFDQVLDDNNNDIPDGDLARTLKRILERNQYQLENAVLDVEYQDLALKLSRLSSPITGILVNSPLTVSGVSVTGADTWVVVDPTSLEFVADLDERDLPKVSVGQRVRLRLDAFPDFSAESQISSISYAPKETTTGTTYEIKLSISQDLLAGLRLGLNGTAEIILQEHQNALTLPAQAVTYSGGDTTVLVKSSRGYDARIIEIGIDSGNLLEITSGLEAGEVVYVKR